MRSPSVSGAAACRSAAFALLAAFCITAPRASAASSTAPDSVEHHDIVLAFDVGTGQINVVDTVRLPAAPPDGKYVGTLSGRLALDASQTHASQRAIAATAGALSDIVVDVGAKKSFTLKYSGPIHVAPTTSPAEVQRGFSSSPAVVEPRGIYLSKAAYWFVRRPGTLVTYAVTLEGLPADFTPVVPGVAQTSTAGTYRFTRATAADDIHIVAGPFDVTTEKIKVAGKTVSISAYLRTKDTALAQKYLDTTRSYLEMYSGLIGPYPYTSFSLVENFWETGYGMPEFTLLGPKIIRFPFILHSSYPHELLHNWWGNSVYTPERGDNWAEGLTAYLADHLVAQQRGKGVDHRRAILVRFRDHVRASNDFALRTFSGRDSPHSEAIGYGKWAMVLHMLRQRIGDEAFKTGLRNLYTQHRFTRASFADVARAFGDASPLASEAFFRGWLDTKGAPVITWDDVQSLRDRSGQNTLTLTLRQAQAQAPFPLIVPVVATLENGDTQAFTVDLNGRTGRATVKTAAPAVRIDIDPYFDTFRHISPGEVAPTLSGALGAKRLLCVLPENAGTPMKKNWRALCEKWGHGANMQVVTDREFTGMPHDRSVIVLGYDNLLRGAAQVGAKAFGMRFDDLLLEVDGELRDNRKQHVALAVNHPTSVHQTLLFVAAAHPDAVAALARKLPHYGKYGYLAFEGAAVDNRVKGQWTATASPLTLYPNGATTLAPAPVHENPLVVAPSPFDGARMQKLVEALSDTALGGRRGPGKAMEKTRALLELSLRQAGLVPSGSRGYRSCAAAKDGGPEICNLIGKIVGRDPKLPQVVLGAHYDHLGAKDGRFYRGANDNASGVAVALEVARALTQGKRPLRTVTVVLFDGEERGLLGSTQYVTAQTKSDEPHATLAMVNLDVVGAHDPARGFSLFGGESAAEWMHIFHGVSFVTGHRTRLLPPQEGGSDHVAFLNAGIPAVHLFSGPYATYHQPGDVPALVRPGSLEGAAAITAETVRYLQNRERPLSGKSAQDAASGDSAVVRRRNTGRPVRFGVVPDFDFAGNGVRVYDVGTDTPAALAGVQKGDVLVGFDGRALRTLRQLSFMLRRKKPGDTVSIELLREGQKIALTATLAAAP